MTTSENGEFGRVLAVSVEIRTDQLTQDEAAAATTLHVDDATPFRETGGLLKLTDDDGLSQNVSYISADLEEDTLTLAEGLQLSWPEGTEVMPLPRRNSRMAYIQLDDPDLPPIMARVPYSMRQQLPVGMRSDELAENDLSIRSPENVIVELVAGNWVVTDIVGIETAIEFADAEAQVIEKSFTIPGGVEAIDYPQLWPAPTNLRFVRVDVVAGTPPTGGDLEMNLRLYSRDAQVSQQVFATDARLIVPEGEKTASAEIDALDTQWLQQVVLKREKVGVRVVTANGAAGVVVSCVFEPIGPQDAEPPIIEIPAATELAGIADVGTSGIGGLPIFRSAGPKAEGTGAITPGMPVAGDVQQGDIMLLFLETADQAITVSGGTETWTQVADSPVSVAGVTRLTAFWARASQDDPTPPTTSDSGDHQLGQIVVFRNCVTSGTPYDVTSPSTDATVNTSVSAAGDTTTEDRTLVVVAVATSSTGHFTGFVNADLSDIQDLVSSTTTQGNDGSLGIGCGAKADAGAYGATTDTLTVAGAKAMLTIALKGVAM